MIAATGRADTIWACLLAGAASWVVIYLLLPKPMWVYVFGHELTHAVWTWCFGGRVKKFKATSKGGHVIVTKSNFLITLAPYFFPIYAVLLFLLFLIGSLIWPITPYAFWFHLLLGAAYAFHLTFTVHVLSMEQSDVTENGILFSAVTIFLGNLLVLILGLPLITRGMGLLTALSWWAEEVSLALRRLGQLI
ncbi:MAG: M50 family metallopeptidase [Verrucomicrobiota bacterium]|nr:M50 family metallopeptidase [Verrucomicrobiota bacterium]